MNAQGHSLAWPINIYSCYSKLVNLYKYTLINVEKCYVLNTFTTNLKWQVTIGGKKSNFSHGFKLEPITIYHL